MTDPIRPVPEAGSGLTPARPPQPPEGDFKALLAQRLQGGKLKFSNHAVERLSSRQIELSSADLDSLAEATDRAAAKGSKDSLVLLRDLALIVNVKNRTVRTALARGDMQEKVITNIDSTVIAEDSTDRKTETKTDDGTH